MSDLPQEFDLKFLPDWLKESPETNRYADYQGESDRPRRDDRGGPRGPRPGGDRRGPGAPRPGGDRRGPGSGPGGNRPQGDRRGPRPGGPGGPGRDRGPGGQGGPGGRRDDRRDDRRRDDRPPREAPRPAPAGLKVEILPEPNAAAGIAKQIKASGRAYAVFSTSKLFLERPERHRVRISSTDAAVPLFQVGDGPISFDRALIERNAFFSAKEEFYTEETVQGEPIKGNFSNVARARSSGALLGPTNHHGYQPALRKLYEERFARRMSFQEFQYNEIEVVTDEQSVADWKEQARTSTTYATTKEAEPITFKSLFDTEQHFRKNYLAQIVKSGQTLECSGQAARAGGDRHVGGAVREAWEGESRFPQQIVNGLRPFLMEVGLHFFKHRKRVLFVSATKPQRHPVGQTFSDGIAAILKTVETSPRIKRPDLATKILGEAQETPEALAKKAQLAADLHYLIHEGHVIEFSDGALELPLNPLDKPQQQQNQGGNKQKPKQPAQGQPAAAAAAAATAAVPAGEASEATAESEAALEAVEADSEAPTESAEPTPEGALTESEETLPAPVPVETESSVAAVETVEAVEAAKSAEQPEVNEAEAPASEPAPAAEPAAASEEPPAPEQH